MDASTEGTADLSGIKHEGARAALAAAIDDLATTEGFRRWLDARTRFHTYSFNNTVLIVSQRPDATQVAGYRAWQALGRQVRKGEKGITILAPMVGKTTDANGDESRRVFGFKAAHVFDIAQTDGEPLADPPVTRVQGSEDAAYTLNRGLLEVLRAESLDLEFRALPGDLNGFYQRDGALIVLAVDMPAAQQAKTLAHELAHHFDPDRPAGAEYRAHRGEAETVAEAAAYVVAGTAGLDTSCYSVGYVAGWTDGDSSQVYKLAQRIDAAANAILAGLRVAESEREEVAA